MTDPFDPSGTIRRVHVGYTPGSEAQLIEEVEASLPMEAVSSAQ